MIDPDGTPSGIPDWPIIAQTKRIENLALDIFGWISPITLDRDG
jgi:hypothetical protein